MTPTERTIQFRIVQNDIIRAQDLVGALAFALPTADDKQAQAAFDRLMKASEHMAAAVRELKAAETVGDTLSILERSIELARAAKLGNVRQFPKNSA